MSTSSDTVSSQIQTIQTEKAPQAIGPYSQGKVFGNLLFTSGQIALDKNGNDYTQSSIEEQTHLAIQNLREVLRAGGSDLQHVIKTTIFLQDMDDFQKVNSIYGTYFTEQKPARSTVAVRTLPKHARIEIEAIAFVP